MPRSGFSSKVLGFTSGIPFSATGGTTTDSGGYRYHTFNASGNFVVTGSKSMDILVVGGGSGGGDSYGSKFGSNVGPGGGAGTFTTATTTVSAGTYPITVGAGGAQSAKGVPSLFKLTDTSSYAVGDTGPAGGKIFMTPSTSGNNTGLYFEVAPVASEVSRTWAQTSLQSTLVDGAKFFEIGTGSIITPKIVAQGNSSASTCAATYCDNYTYGGYSDWFLPSYNEMYWLYQNRVAVNSSITGTYWTCTEDKMQRSYFAYNRVWAVGLYTNVTGKNNSYPVRPVRAFTASTFNAIYAVGGSETSNDNFSAGGNSNFEGGREYSYDYVSGGGGGGTSGVGGNAVYTGVDPYEYSGNGGAGSTWNSFKSFGGGGGGGGRKYTGGSAIPFGIGGTTGGGAGGNADTFSNGVSGTANTGGGGGGSALKDYDSTAAGSGGSGVVIVRYLLA